MVPVLTQCDIIATVEKVYNQVYNGKSRHILLRHSLVRYMIIIRIITIDYLKLKENLTDHITKGLSKRDGVKDIFRDGAKYYALNPLNKT